MTRVLVIGAHPDDPELMAGGTLLKHRAQGDGVAIAYLTDGRYGGPVGASASLGERRYKESENACTYIGAQMFWGGLEDGFLTDSPEARKICVDIIRRAQPDLIVTHSTDDYHCDHTACQRIVRAANMLAATAAYHSNYPALPHLCRIWLMDPLGFPNPRASIFIPIDDVISRKMEALSKYTSQLEWMSSEGIDIVDLVWTQAALRGQQCGALLAEAFQPLEGWGLTHPTALFSAAKQNPDGVSHKGQL